MNIYQRLNEVRKAVDYIQKDDKLVGGKYKAVTHDSVTAAIRGHLIEHGVMIVPSIESSKVEATGTTTGKGVPYIRYEAIYRVQFVNCDAPEEIVPMMVEAHALDEGDKAPGKALSYAVKGAMLKLFSIETGEDDEGRSDQKRDKVTPRAGAYDSLSADMQIYVTDYSNEVRQLLGHRS